MNYPLIALGELLIDFTPAGVSAANRPLYEQNPGGAPANVLCAAARQGIRGALISCVGNDMFGSALLSACAAEGIDTSAVQITAEAATTMAFVRLDDKGERDFAFARKPGADMLLDAAKLPFLLLEDCRLFHFGSLSLCTESSKHATFAAADRAKAGGATLSYDPNWRPMLWTDREAGIAALREGLARAELCKLSEEELYLLLGDEPPIALHTVCGDSAACMAAAPYTAQLEALEQASQKLIERYISLRLVVVTRGAKGCFYRSAAHSGSLPTYDIPIIDTTGAGDAFWGVFLSQWLSSSALCGGSIPALEQALRRANAAGALCAAARGALCAMPSQEAVESLVQTGNLLSI